LGSRVRLRGTSSNDNPGAYVTAAQDSSKKLWYISTNPWGVQSATGWVSTEYTGSGEVNIDVNMSNITGSFGGYPSIFYGRSPWNYNHTMGQLATFPVQVSQIQTLTCLTGYSLTYEAIGGNIAYDLWVTDAQLPDNMNNGIEIMIWFWQNNTSALGTLTTISTKEITLNNSAQNYTFNVYKQLKTPSSNWDVVSFLIDDSQAIVSGEVEIDLLDFVETALTVLSKSESVYLQDIEFGVEFTNNDQNFNFQLTKFDIDQN